MTGRMGQDRKLGLLRMMLALPRGPRAALRRWWASMRGIVAGMSQGTRARVQGRARRFRHEQRM